MSSPRGRVERRRKGESEKMRAEGREEERTVNATGCGKFEYGICLLVSPSLFAEAREEGKDGLRRKDEVCNWCNICGLQGGINVCSLRALSPSSLHPPPFLPPPPRSLAGLREESSFFPYRAVSFPLLLIPVTFNRVCFHFSRFF